MCGGPPLPRPAALPGAPPRSSMLHATLGLIVGYGAPAYLEAALQLLARAPHVPLAAVLCVTVGAVAALPDQVGAARP